MPDPKAKGAESVPAAGGRRAKSVENHGENEEFVVLPGWLESVPFMTDGVWQRRDVYENEYG